jgi:hypothetical protein
MALMLLGVLHQFVKKLIQKAMKTIRTLMLSLVLLTFTACEYYEHPYVEGENLIGSVFELKGDFTDRNDFALNFEFPKSFIMYESDIVVVYILWEQTTGTNGKTLDVWRLLPQTVVLEEGVLQYNFDYTLRDVEIFLDGTIDFNTLLPSEYKDQVFRIAVLPADFAINHSIDLKDYNLVMKSLNINPAMIQKIKTIN